MNATLATVLALLLGLSALGVVAVWLGVRLGRHLVGQIDRALEKAFAAFREHRL